MANPYVCLWDVEGRKGQSCSLRWRDPFSDEVAMQFMDGFVLVLSEQAFGIDWPSIRAVAVLRLAEMRE